LRTAFFRCARHWAVARGIRIALTGDTGIGGRARQIDDIVSNVDVDDIVPNVAITLLLLISFKTLPLMMSFGTLLLIVYGVVVWISSST
jgi:hypothetical protein